MRREVDEALACLESVGFITNAHARNFLREYHGRRFRHLPAKNILGEIVWSWTWFDPSLVCTETDADVAHRCSEVAGVGLCPLGVDSFHLTVYSGDDGKFYAGVDSLIFRYGENIDELSAMMWRGVRPVLLGEWSIR
ncbi:SUKH-3 immunity protein [Lentzea fradiae]|uniref:SUKH-3 immunity protein n=1 Tax=Lentzea fradiae TaxID=200378 RepID=A0A1G7YTN8_9PSEU|nr:SUKH-3 domain-containing protein [Lentzea fradiae]SDG99240.1 SUKH-3 immunity protein [Lentzea fradiae]